MIIIRPSLLASSSASTSTRASASVYNGDIKPGRRPEAGDIFVGVDGALKIRSVTWELARRGLSDPRRRATP
jgi:hypothetical protein